MSTTVIIGATSAMAEHAARCFAADGDHLVLTARDEDKLSQVAEDLRIRGASQVDVLPTFDAIAPQGMDALLEEIRRSSLQYDRVLIAHGSLPDQGECEKNEEAMHQALEVNFSSTIRLCTLLANKLSEQEAGMLAVISSVAGLRGRQSNYVYGAAKGGLNIFLQGLRNRLFEKGVRVLTILPGFVDTPMTQEIEKGPLFVSAETAGTCIHKAMTKSSADVVYVPFFWRYILWVIRAIPESLFKRLKL